VITRNFVIRLILPCLLLLSACATVAPPPVPRLTVTACAPVMPCILSASRPMTNGELLMALERIEADWALCAAQVDAIIACQQSPRAPSHDAANPP